jgi:hypothetical protein
MIANRMTGTSRGLVGLRPTLSLGSGSVNGRVRKEDGMDTGLALMIAIAIAMLALVFVIAR